MLGSLSVVSDASAASCPVLDILLAGAHSASDWTETLAIASARLDALASAECGAVAEMSEQFKQVALLVGPTGDEDFERFCAERDA